MVKEDGEVPVKAEEPPVAKKNKVGDDIDVIMEDETVTQKEDATKMEVDANKEVKLSEEKATKEMQKETSTTADDSPALKIKAMKQ